MNSKSRFALFLVGSPRGFSSTSATLGTYLLDRMKARGFETEKLHIQTAMRSAEGKQNLVTQASNCDVLLLAFPLFADSLPAPVIATLEMLAEQRKKDASSKIQLLMTIVNNGFPEAQQNAIAVQICRRFAKEAGLKWAGGLSLGGGGAINGVPLEKAGFVARNAKKALDYAANDLIEGRAISKQAVELMVKPSIPRWLYLWMSNRGWKQQAKACGAEDRLYDRP